YFAAPIQHRLTLASMKELSAELHALAPTLLTRTPPQHIAVEPSPAAGELPVVQAVLKGRPEGGALLIAGNSSFYPVDAKWNLSALGDGLRVADFFSQKAVPLNNGVLSDRFDGYGTRVYVIQGGSRERGEKTVLRLALSGEAVERLKEQKRPAEPPRLNLLASPSFEEEGKAWTIQGKGMTFAAEGRNGSRCLKVSRTNPREVVNITAEPVTLKPNTRYRFGGWVKSRLTEGQQSGACYLNDLGETPRVSAGIPFPPTHGEWRMVSREIPTPDGPPVKAKFWYQVAFGIAGDIWIDDVFVEEVPPVPVEAKPKNVIINSSFEAAAVPGWPDSWFFGTTKPGQMIGDPGGPGQDAAHAYHGKHSLKIANPFDHSSGFANARYVHKFTSGGLRGGIAVEVGKTYTFSVYLRAEQAGTKADLLLCNFAHNAPVSNEGTRQTFSLTTDWKRYQVSCMIPKDGWTRGIRPEVAVLIYNKGVKTAIWADAAQLEEGEQATAYMPSE
ncbi:MAG: hypothetical protein FJ278_18410, partial [Planctomycetes bacterium]|nr:hypothetical protein [Planctomycetota bacterium]